MNQWICPVGGKSAGVHLAVDPILQLIHRKNWTPNIQSFGKHSPCPRYSVANLDDEAGRMLFFPVFPLFFRIYGEFLCISRKSMSVKRVVYDGVFWRILELLFQEIPETRETLGFSGCCWLGRHGTICPGPNWELFGKAAWTQLGGFSQVVLP